MPLTFIASATASNSATLEFTSGIDGTYNEYQFHIVNVHPATNNVNFTFQVNASGGSGFNETITSTSFRQYLNESGSGGTFAYDTGSDQALGTGYQRILSTGTGNENDESSSGFLTLYDPASTTYVKHFSADGNGYDHGDWTVHLRTGGYIGTTSAIDEISFKFDSGNIDSGTIYMYGVG
jgi:hypothetical protein